MIKEARELLLNIARCQNVELYYKHSKCVCSEIIKTQNRKKEKFVLPEPWNGNLETAKVLVISSNPSFSDNEIFPKMDWHDEKIIDFFNNRFSSNYTYISKYNRVSIINLDGTHGKAEPFWGYIRNRIAELLYNNCSKLVKHGEDYCLTEIVHCKSKNENGLNCLTISECYNKYFNKIISLSNCKVVIIVGNKAFKTLITSGIKISEALLGEDDKKIYSEEVELENGNKKLFTYLDAPASGKPLKSFNKFPKEELEKIKNILL
ncbi:hypothetical protein [Pseudobacteroides cellulosolvens]|uniref:Uracil-DNA glycosylase superfamily n=1 Tax=Pseudobacteroides cellulosolvens ATCC 35603 = DSM 2933 TaxID=398512 RepID=A0A0L6JPV2_9FIRM|nr:hypothetical protein [Pseudobacteroides cellulosolvens]KNY27871.1 hypothetical protein Bccel_3142 [Pseudobacteroides cellulosolvens ATCC 35603 = DSM 2933]